MERSRRFRAIGFGRDCLEDMEDDRRVFDRRPERLAIVSNRHVRE